MRQDERGVEAVRVLGGKGETPIHPIRSARNAPGLAGALTRRLRFLPVALLLAVAALAALAAPRPAHALDPKDRAVVGQAFRAAERGEWERVWRLVALVEDPLPGKTLRWLRMIEDGRPADFATLAGFLMANPDWPLPERLQIRAEETITDPADHELIRRFFADRSPLTTRGRIRYADALFRAGQNERAIELIRLAWVTGDFSAREDRRFYRRYRRHLRQQDHIARLDSLLWDHRRGSATRMLERVPAGYRRLAEARMRLQRRQHGVDRAIEAVPAALRNEPGLTFDRLRWRRKQRLYDGVAEILLDPPRVLGRPDRWWFERELQIRRSLRRRDFDLAYRLASRHGQTEGDDFVEAEWLAGWLALRFADQPSAAFRRFVSMYEAVASPTGQAKAAYWAGRSAAALGDRALARSWYQAAARHRIAYYGQLAAIELGQTPEPVPVPPPAPGERAAFEANEVTRVARMLIEVGAHDQLRPFAMHLAAVAESPTEVGMVADLIATSGRADLVTQAARYAAHHGQVNEAAAFPIPDLPGLLDTPDGYPEPALLLGLARQESTFDSWGVSHAGAQGMLQLMPRTARLMARALGVPYNRGRLTADPDYNIRLGSYYLSVLLERYDGEVVLAITAYNAGPSRVERWIRRHGDPRHGDRHALVDWVELIPFDETRNYVKRVLEARTRYRERLADADVTTISFLEVNGPLTPVPRPDLKPLDAARQARNARLVAEAPLPRLKPDIEPSGAPTPGEPTPGEILPAAFRIPQARPDLVHFSAAELDAIKTTPWPELKPDRPLALIGADAPQPELKPR